MLNRKTVFLSSAGNSTQVSSVMGVDTDLYTTEELRVWSSLRTVFHQMRFWIKSWSKKVHSSPRGELSFGVPRDRRGCSPLYYRGTTLIYRLRTIFQSSFQRCFQMKSWTKKSVFLSSAGNWTPVSRVIGGDTHHYTTEELHVWISLWTVFHQMWFWTKSWSKKDHSSPRRGIEFRSPAWQAGMLTTILPRNCVTVSFAGHFSASFQRCFQMKSWTKKSVFISSACTWTPVSRVTGWDTHHYTTEELHVSISLWTVFHQMWFWTKSWSKKDHSSPRRGIEFRSPAWEAGMLTTILPRNCVSISFAYHFSPSFQRYFQIKCWTKKSVFLSSAGNWTRSLAAGDTHHYTIEELHA